MFACDCCGQCCQNLHKSELYKDLDRGDGICKFFCENTNLCTIYEQRPIICNIDKMYKSYFKDFMTKEKYYQMNRSVCQNLRKEASKRQ